MTDKMCKCKPVVHHQKLEFSDVVNNKLLEAVGEVVAGLLVRPVPNIGHESDSLELSPDPGVNTLGPPPTRLHVPSKI